MYLTAWIYNHFNHNVAAFYRAHHSNTSFTIEVGIYSILFKNYKIKTLKQMNRQILKSTGKTYTHNIIHIMNIWHFHWANHIKKNIWNQAIRQTLMISSTFFFLLFNLISVNSNKFVILTKCSKCEQQKWK